MSPLNLIQNQRLQILGTCQRHVFKKLPSFLEFCRKLLILSFLSKQVDLAKYLINIEITILCKLFSKGPEKVLKRLIFQIQWSIFFSKNNTRGIYRSKRQYKQLSLSQKSIVYLRQFYSEHVKNWMLIQSKILSSKNINPFLIHLLKPRNWYLTFQIPQCYRKEWQFHKKDTSML